MSAYGPNPPSATAVDASDLVWVNPTYVYADDGQYAYNFPWTVVGAPPEDPVVLQEEANRSETVKWTNFGFSVPSNYSVTRVKVSMRRYQTAAHYSGAEIVDMTVKLVVGGTATGTNNASGTAWSLTEAAVDYDYDLEGWGLSGLTPAQANASNFGVAFQIKGFGGPVPYPSVPPDIAPTGYVDYVTITLTAEPNYVKVDSVLSKFCYTIASAIPGQDGGVSFDYLSFSPKRKLRALRNSGHIDEIEWDSTNGVYIEGLGRDAGYEMPDGYWESKIIRGENSRVAEVGLDRDEHEAIDVTVTSDDTETTNTVALDARYTRFGIAQRGFNHRVRIAVTEGLSGVQRLVADIIKLSQGLKR